MGVPPDRIRGTPPPPDGCSRYTAGVRYASCLRSRRIKDFLIICLTMDSMQTLTLSVNRPLTGHYSVHSAVVWLLRRMSASLWPLAKCFRFQIPKLDCVSDDCEQLWFLSRCLSLTRVSWSIYLLAKAKLQYNKTVLLRERKRHTARRVVSTPSVVLTGYPPPRPDLAQGCTLLGGTLLSWPGGYPTWVNPRQGIPPSWPGKVPPPLSWTWLGTPPMCLPHGILGNVAKHYGIWVPPPSWTWLGTPPRVCPMAFWVMLQSIMGYGYPPSPTAGPGWVPPPRVWPMAFWVMLQSIMGYG